MTFMCKAHREQLANKPEYALAVWQRLIGLAREKHLQQSYDQAVVLYGNALDAATITFIHAPASNEAKRYLRTATELIYAVRCSKEQDQLVSIVSGVKTMLEKVLYPANAQLMLRPIDEATNCSLTDLKHWMLHLLPSQKMTCH